MTLAARDLNLLVALRALLEQGNVTRAGEVMGVSQSAMSSYLSRLRRHYRDDLLVRLGREYELTPLARSLLPEVQATLPLLETALRLRSDFAPDTSVRVFDIAMSDYASTLIGPGLTSRLVSEAAGVRVRLHPTPPDLHVRPLGMLDFDMVVAPLGFGFTGDSIELFRDRFVCVVDRCNPRLLDGRLSLEDLEQMPQARAGLGVGSLAPFERRLAELGVQSDVKLRTRGWLPVPHVVSGTQMVGIVPERLALRAAESAHIAVVEPPFGDVDLVEGLWWHPTRRTDQGSRWLKAVIQQVGEDVGELSTVLSG